MTAPLDALLAYGREFEGGAVTADMRAASDAFLAAAADDSVLLAVMAAALPAASPVGTCWLATILGVAVERGAPADAAGPHLFAVFRTWLGRLPASDAESTELSDEQRMTVDLLPHLAQPIVSHLAAAPAWRDSLAQDDAVRRELGERWTLTHAVVWVYEAIARSSGIVTLLHVDGGGGVRVRYENVGANYQLFSLLQNAVGERLPGGHAPRRDADGTSQRYSGTSAWWHYGKPTSPVADFTGAIDGGAYARDLPRVDGEQVMLVGPQLFQGRSWDASFFAPELRAMPPSAVVDSVLTDDEFAAWLRRLGIDPVSTSAPVPPPEPVPAEPRRPWWRFW